MTRRACVPDHPRSRGEYLCWRRTAPTILGSSPLSRGIHWPGRAWVTKARIIPALAGNTVPCWCQPTAHPDHPRSRGEYQLEPVAGEQFRGSSPLSRGIRVRPVGWELLRGIIPALAGNTGQVIIFVTRRFGSSPLSRGILLSQALSPETHGIIPALAGNTVRVVGADDGTKDHPRSRGEYGCPPARPPTARGSSPLSRGIRDGSVLHDHLPGIIPALAGNTRWGWSFYGRAPDHPRSRGEYIYPCASEDFQRGSSPLSRGIQCPYTDAATPSRIIPALAGNTS